MSAVRKQLGTAKPDKTPSTPGPKDKSKSPAKAKGPPSTPAKQPKAKDVTAIRGRFNPLPPDAVGARLLVLLQAEYVMKKVHLKEAWEGPEGWRFDELCAVVACRMGEGFVDEGERVVANRVEANRDAKLIARINERTPLLFEENLSGRVATPEAFEVLLILGLGAPGCLIALDNNLTDTDALAKALGEALRTNPNNDPTGPGVHAKVNARTFERAKNNVLKRYAEHLHNQETRRSKMGADGEVKPVRIRRRTQTELLRKALKRFAIPPVASGNARLLNAAFKKAGLRPPAKWSAAPGGQ